MPLFKPHSEFPTPLFKMTLIFLAGLSIGAGVVYWQLNPFVGQPTPVEQNPQQASEPAAEDPTADWTKYSSSEGEFSLSYNPDWQVKTCDDVASTVFLAPTSQSQVICNSEHGSQVSVLSQSGDRRSQVELSADYFSNITTQSVTVDGVTGKRQQGMVAEVGEGPAGDPVGSTRVVYYFYTNSRTYIATYIQTATGDYTQNILDDFDQMVKSTLKFSS